MVDRAKKVTELVAATSVAANDLFLVVGNTSGVATTKKVTAAAMFANVAANANFIQINVGSNVSLNTSSIKLGNSTVNVSVNSSVVTIGSGLTANATTVLLGNSTVNSTVNSTSFHVRNSNAVIRVDSYQWIFDSADGLLYLPKNASNTSGIVFPFNISGGSGDESHILYKPTGGGEDIVLELLVRNNGDDKIRLDSSGNVEIITDGTGTPEVWVFGKNGSLVFPNNTAQTTAWAGIPGPYADDTAAAAANVAIGYPYHKTGTGGQVFVRLA